MPRKPRREEEEQEELVVYSGMVRNVGRGRWRPVAPPPQARRVPPLLQLPEPMLPVRLPDTRRRV